jgi:hypothetical protein
VIFAHVLLVHNLRSGHDCLSREVDIPKNNFFSGCELQMTESVIATPAFIFCFETPTTNASIQFETLVSTTPEGTEKLQAITKKRNSVYHGIEKKYLDSALNSIVDYYPSFLGLVCSLQCLSVLMFR